MARKRTQNREFYNGGRSRRQRARRRIAARQYADARRLAVDGQVAEAKRHYERLREQVSDRHFRALVQNDLAVLATYTREIEAAIKGFHAALVSDPDCEPARLNLALVEADMLVEGRGLTVEGGQNDAGERRDADLRFQIQDLGPQNLDQEEDVKELPKCLLLMVTCNRLEYTKLALEALIKVDYPGLEIVVWDNASTDGTAEYLKDRLGGVGNVHVELSPSNRGVVFPMNAIWGSKRDVGVLAKVDNDTLVPPELLRRLAACHVRSTHFGVLSGFHFRREGEAIADEKNVVAVKGARVFRQRFVGGCAVMIRRELFDEIGAIPTGRQDASPLLLSPEGRGGNGPFMDGGWTAYQQRLDELGYINGYPWPFVHVDHMEDTRSPHCIRTKEHEEYKRALRGMSLEEFTRELCVWKPH